MALGDFRAVCLPYCLKKQDDGTWLVLNREYSPLSFNTHSNDFLKQDLPIYLKIKDLTAKKIEKILQLGEGAALQNDGRDLFLYNDGTNPFRKEHRKVYFKRLEILMELSIE